MVIRHVKFTTLALTAGAARVSVEAEIENLSPVSTMDAPNRVISNAANLVINEFVFNHTGTDSEEFVELYGDPDTDYSDHTLVVIDGDAGSTGTITRFRPTTPNLRAIFGQLNGGRSRGSRQAIPTR